MHPLQRRTPRCTGGRERERKRKRGKRHVPHSNRPHCAHTVQQDAGWDAHLAAAKPRAILGRYVRKILLRARVNVIDGDDVISRLESVHHGHGGGLATGKSKPICATHSTLPPGDIPSAATGNKARPTTETSNSSGASTRASVAEQQGHTQKIQGEKRGRKRIQGKIRRGADTGGWTRMGPPHNAAANRWDTTQRNARQRARNVRLPPSRDARHASKPSRFGLLSLLYM